MQILLYWRDKGDPEVVVTILLDICFAAASFQNIGWLMEDLDRLGKKIGIFAACSESQEAYGASFSCLVCDADLSEVEKKSILQD